MLHDPEIVFLDEPTAGVTPAARARFWALIRDLAAQHKTIFVTTHYMDEAEQCDRIALMRTGRIVALDTPAQLKKAVFPGQLYELDPRGKADFARLEKLRRDPEIRIFRGLRIALPCRVPRQRGRAAEIPARAGLSGPRNFPDARRRFHPDRGGRQPMSYRWSRAAAVARKEVYHVLRDPFTLMLALGLPVFMVFMFGFAIEFNVKDIHVAMFDADHSRSSRQLADTFGSSGYFIVDHVASPDAAPTRTDG